MSFSSLRKKVGNFIAGDEGGGTKEQGTYSDKNHSPLPVDPYLYPGIRYEFCFDTIDVLNVTETTLTQVLVSSDITTKYGELSKPYGQGYLLADFNNVPGIGKIGWGASESPFQAVFSRPIGPPVQHSWQLLVVKSSIRTYERAGLLNQLSGRNNEVANTSGLVAAISQQAGRGGRLVCIEHTGQRKTAGFTKSLMGAGDETGCDVFFNMPRHSNPIRYTYQLVNVPVQVLIFGPGKLVKVSCDWMKHFVSYLQQGWRLAEIFWDQGKRSHGDFTLSGDHNSVWFFEKEAARLNDPTPMYHGQIIEYKHTVKIGFFQTKAKGDWAPMISEMGSRGWEIACMLETPEVTNVGLGTITYKILFFFQRKIVQGQGQGQGQGHPNYGPPVSAPNQPYPPPPRYTQGNFTQYPPPAASYNYAGAQYPPQGPSPQGPPPQGPPPQGPPPQALPPQGPPPPYSGNNRAQPSAPPLPEKR